MTGLVSETKVGLNWFPRRDLIDVNYVRSQVCFISTETTFVILGAYSICVDFDMFQ